MPYKMAIIGFGGMGSYHHENVTATVPEFEIVAGYDIREEVREQIAALKMRAYESPEELYADKSIDFVLIATPNDVHKSYSIACLKAGKHVMCEKPVTLNAAELIEVMEVSKETGKLFTVHQNRRWDDDYLTIKKILKDGILSKPYAIETRVQGSRQYMHGWRAYKVNGGGMVYDWGVHLIDQLLDLIPEKIVSVSAHLNNIFVSEVDDHFTAMLRFEGGLSALVNVGMNCFIKQPRWHMCCVDGSAVIEDWDVKGNIVKLNPDSDELSWGELIVYTSAGPTRTMAPRPKETTLEVPLPVVKSKGWDIYRNIARAIAGEEELIVKPEQSLRVMKVIDAIFESENNSAVVHCEI